MSFTMQGSSQFVAKLFDGKSSLTESVLMPTSLADGSTAGKANGYWSGTLQIAAGNNATFNLTALDFSTLGLTGSVILASVKYLAIVNQSQNVTLTVEPGATDGWDQIGATVVGKGGSLVLFSGIDGLPLTATSKVVKVTNNDTVTTLTGNTTTGSGAATITDLSSTAGLAVGMTVTGTGIPAGAKIAAVGTTEVTMNASATVDSESLGVSLAFAWPDASVKVYAAGILD